LYASADEEQTGLRVLLPSTAFCLPPASCLKPGSLYLIQVRNAIFNASLLALSRISIACSISPVVCFSEKSGKFHRQQLENNQEK
jgi:hypothetical protein